jgi:hypothetical protein
MAELDFWYVFGNFIGFVALAKLAEAALVKFFKFQPSAIRGGATVAAIWFLAGFVNGETGVTVFDAWIRFLPGAVLAAIAITLLNAKAANRTAST